MIPVAEANEKIIRKSEASLVELKDGSVFLAYASHAGRSDNDRAPLVALKLDREGRPITQERVIVPPPEGGFNAMSPALQRLPDGRLGMLFSYRQSQKIASRRFTTSSDEGETWSPHVTVADGQYKTGCHDRFTVHSSGRLLAPCHCTDDWDKHYLFTFVSLVPTISVRRGFWATRSNFRTSSGRKVPVASRSSPAASNQASPSAPTGRSS